VIYQYGIDEVDERNWQRLLSAELDMVIPVLNPAHGFILTVPAGEIFLFESVYFYLLPVDIANPRVPMIQYYRIGVYPIAKIAPPYTHNVLAARDYTFIRRCIDGQALSRFNHICLPDLVLSQNDTFSLYIFNGEAADTLGECKVYYRHVLLDRP
jgi:hypothetical protein